MLSALDPHTRKISGIATKGSAPSPRWCHAAAPVDQGLLVMGGWNPSAARTEAPFLSDLWLLDAGSVAWSRVDVAGVPPSPRCQCTLAALPDGFLWLFGGAAHADADNPVYGDRVEDLGDMFVLDWKTRTWLTCRSTYLPQRGGVNACALVGEELFVFGGMHSDQGAETPTFKDHVSVVPTSLLAEIARKL